MGSTSPGEHDRLFQEEFDYDHGEYFGRDHMQDRWVPFLKLSLPTIPRSNPKRPLRPPTHTPWGVYVGLATLFLLIAMIGIVCLTIGLFSQQGLWIIGIAILVAAVVNGYFFVHYSKAKP